MKPDLDCSLSIESRPNTESLAEVQQPQGQLDSWALFTPCSQSYIMPHRQSRRNCVHSIAFVCKCFFRSFETRACLVQLGLFNRFTCDGRGDLIIDWTFPEDWAVSYVPEGLGFANRAFALHVCCT